LQVEQFHSHTLHELDKYLRLNRGVAPTTYGQFNKLFAKAPAVPAADPAVPSLPPAPAESDDHPDAEYAVPTLTELGYTAIAPPEKVLYPGGETAGLARLKVSMAKRAWVRAFEKPKTSPNALEPSTTVLSPYLKFGCVSARLFYHELADVYRSGDGKHAKPPVSLHGQLLWREFFYLNGHAVPNFDKMVDNPICRQIPWGDDPALLAAWEEGRTGT
jgi:cryptochrome